MGKVPQNTFPKDYFQMQCNDYPDIQKEGKFKVIQESPPLVSYNNKTYDSINSIKNKNE